MNPGIMFLVSRIGKNIGGGGTMNDNEDSVIMSKVMFIEGKQGLYKVRWIPSGYSYARPCVYEKIIKKGWFSKKEVWKFVWEGESVLKGEAYRSLPEDSRSRFVAVVEEYENHENLWGVVKGDRNE